MMITSKQINKVLEDWDRSVKNGSLSAEVYTNPTSSDLGELNASIDKSLNPKKEVRFIADSKAKKVYVWDSSLSTHRTVSKTLGFRPEGFMSEPLYVFDGFGVLSAGKIVGQFEHGTTREILANIKALTPKSRNNFSKSENDSFLKQVDSIIIKSNWTFVDRYVSGFNAVVGDLKSKFSNWLKT